MSSGGRDSIPAFPHPHRSVPRVDVAVVADVAAALEGDEPVVLPGALAGSATFDKLRELTTDAARLSFLTTAIGERAIRYAELPASGRLPGDDKRVVDAPFSSLAQRLTSELATTTAVRCYLQNHRVDELPELGWRGPDLPYPTSWELARAGLWVGAGDQVVNLHYDNFVNVIAMLSGRKRVSLLPYEVLPDAYAVYDPLTKVTASSVRLLAPDWQRFPRFRRAIEDVRVVVLEPGDALLVPVHWWHHVESFGLSVMVNGWHVPMEKALWLAIGRNRAQAVGLFQGFSPEWRAFYAAHYDRRVFASAAASSDAEVSPPPGPEPFRRTDADRNLEEAADIFSRVSPIWRRHAQLSYSYFAFQRSGRPMDHAPGEFERLTRFLGDKLERGEEIFALV